MLLKDNRTEFTPAPEGLHQAVCVDVIDLGLQENKWGKKQMLRLSWQIEEINDKTSKRFMVGQQFTQSLHKKSRLRPLLEAWRGKKFTDEELQGFDPEVLIGVNCQVQVVHSLGTEGQVYANVQAVVPAPRGAVKMRPENYVRVKDRTDEDNNGHDETPIKSNDADDDVPF